MTTGPDRRAFPDPGWAYVPGRTPRHPPGTFDTLCATVHAGMTIEALIGTDAWRAGLQYLDAGFFWEAHEMFEPVWMAIPDARPERFAVQAVIQIANASLKLRMDRPRATVRLCDMADALLVDGQAGLHRLGLDEAALRTRIEGLRRAAIR